MTHIENNTGTEEEIHQEENQTEINQTPPTPEEEAKPAENPQPQEDWKEKYVRLYAEFENTKKRLQRDQLNWHLLANKNLILDLLPTLDDLERAIENLKQSEDSQQDTQQGLTLILTNLHTQLEEKGLKPMDVQIGQEPNPQEHHILTKVTSPQEKLKGKITEVVTKGYLLHNHVIRHAQVTIGA